MINFYNEDVAFRLTDRRVLKQWIKETVETEMKLTGEVSFIFVSDQYLLQINQQYLKHDTLTDVVTFDYSEGDHISGDIFISVPRVKENAATFAVDFRDELHRVMIHGVLHLIGYKDKTKFDEQTMREKEDYYLLRRWKSNI